MTKSESISIIEISISLEEIRDNIYRINDAIEKQFINELLLKEILSLDAVIGKILILGAKKH